MNGIQKRVRHKKRGSEYEVLGPGFIQSDVPLNDMDDVVIYRDLKDGTLVARRASEMVDGRFEDIP